MFKYKHLREEDYWLYPIGFFTVLATALVFYASVMTFRGPAIVISAFGLWFSFNKIKNGYSLRRARTSLVLQLIISAILAYGLYVLTN